ncbi:MAG: alpha/beta fold hydrolase [Solirubrobacterales bacterium]|nr:alpha/beta fold hydrolase [Solirubrobacterales bacterium]
MRTGAADAHTHPPVLVLTGIGLTAAVASRLLAELEVHFRVLAAPVAYGDRSVGDEIAPTSADRALALLDALGADQAHVVGLSFGGAIAQQIAIRHPQRVRSLVLASSTAGGERYVPAQRAIRDFLGRLAELPAEEGLWASVPHLYAATTCRRHAPLIGEDIAHRLTRPLDPRSYDRQHAAARAHDPGARLAGIAAPTLVLHGEEDRILPLDNGRRLAEGIAGARFVPVPGGAHALPTDAPDSTSELVSFLLAHSRRRASSAARRTGRATRA